MMTQVEGCPFGIDCLRVTEDNPLCGPARSSNEFALETLELPPLPLAEDICPGLLELRFRLSVKEENEPTQAGKWWAQAWSQLELALPLADKNEAQKHFDNVDWLLGRVLGDPEAAFTKSIDAETLRATYPILLRAKPRSPTPTAKIGPYHLYGRVVHKDRSYRKIPSWKARIICAGGSACALFALGSRILSWFASRRTLWI